MAQRPIGTNPAASAMGRLAYMAGNWQGEGWMLSPTGDRAAFRGGELVQSKLNGLALLVEGNFLGRPPGADRDLPVHTTLGVMSYDPDAGSYRFHTWLATGGSGVRELAVTDSGWRWEVRSRQGVIRFTMALTPSGEWFEIGERSRDGTNWQQFFEMRLRKTP